MKNYSRSLIGIFLAFSSFTACSMNLIDASYDPATDELVFKIAYRGTHPKHTFTVSWEACRTLSDGHREIFGIVLDSDPTDPANLEFEKTERIRLKDFSCRPATVTIGLASPLYRRTLTVPARPK